MKLNTKCNNSCNKERDKEKLSVDMIAYLRKFVRSTDVSKKHNWFKNTRWFKTTCKMPVISCIRNISTFENRTKK